MKTAGVLLVAWMTILLVIGPSASAWSQDQSGGIQPEQRSIETEESEGVTLPRTVPIEPVPIMKLRCGVIQKVERRSPKLDISIAFTNIGDVEIPPDTEIVWSLPNCSSPQCRGEYSFKEALKPGQQEVYDVIITDPVADPCEVRFKKYRLEP